MNYQSIRAKIEGPLLTAFNNQIPSIPVYFDNITAVPPDPPNEYVRVNVTFGLTTECTLEGSLDNARGAVIVRCFAPKSAGPARCQQLMQIAKEVFDTISATRKTSTSTFVRIKEISGPEFGEVQNSPHFAGRMSAGWIAMVK